MANNEIIIRKEAHFKSKELNSAVVSFDKFFSGINKNWRDACILMHRLQDGKKYEEDGFKSVAEFAETIGIDKSSAHHMADAGMVYDSKVPEIAQFAQQAGYTKASKIASLVKDGKEAKVKAAIEDGSLAPSMTVNDIASWKATESRKENGDKVVPNWRIQLAVFMLDKDSKPQFSTETRVVGISDPIDFAHEFDSESVVAKVKLPDGSALYVASAPSGMFNYTAERIKKAGGKVRKEKDISKEELIALAEKLGLKVSF